MPEKYTNDEEKARILAWRQENVPIMVICERSGRGKATIMRLLAVAKYFPNNTVPKHKFGGGRKKKTSPHTDTIIKLNYRRTLVWQPWNCKISIQSYCNMWRSVQSSIVIKKTWILQVVNLPKNLWLPREWRQNSLHLQRNTHIAPLNSGGKWCFPMRAISKSLRWGLPLHSIQDHQIALILDTLFRLFNICSR